MIDRNGQAITYIYDPGGNIFQIARKAGIRQDQTSIGSMKPPNAA